MHELQQERAGSGWSTAVIGFALPVVVAMIGAGLTVAGVELSDGRVLLLLAVTLVGLPLAVTGAVESLPRSFGWWERVGLACLFVPPLFAVAVYVALTVYGIAYCAVGAYRL